MTFPVLAASNSSREASDTTSHTVSLPSGIASGHKLIVAFTADGTPTITWPAGWTVLVAATAHGTATTEIRERIADGSEGASISFTTSAAEQSAHNTFRITGADPALSSVATATGANPSSWNPPNLAPAGGSQDYLWLEVVGQNGPAGAGDDTTVSAGYTIVQGIQSSAAGSPVRCKSGSKSATASSDNPGAGESTSDWLAATIAVAPTSGPTTHSIAGTLTGSASATCAAGLRRRAAGTLTGVASGSLATSVTRSAAGTLTGAATGSLSLRVIPPLKAAVGHGPDQAAAIDANTSTFTVG